MQQHVRRARRVRAREVADDRVEAERRLDRGGLEPAIEHLARALGEEVEHVALPRAGRARGSACATFQRVEHRADAAADVGRRLEHELAQHVGDAIEHRVVARQALGVARENLRDLGLRRREPAADLEISAVGQRQEIRERPLDDREPVLARAAGRGSPWD